MDYPELFDKPGGCESGEYWPSIRDSTQSWVRDAKLPSMCRFPSCLVSQRRGAKKSSEGSWIICPPSPWKQGINMIEACNWAYNVRLLHRLAAVAVRMACSCMALCINSCFGPVLACMAICVQKKVWNNAGPQMKPVRAAGSLS